MTDEAFLAAIADAPRDGLTWLAYADWLEERGDPRAEWLRLQDILSRPVQEAGRYTDLCAREQELWRALDPVWLHAVRRYTTAPPCRDIAALVPALAPFADCWFRWQLLLVAMLDLPRASGRVSPRSSGSSVEAQRS
ncbi:MAG: TIGR02996 domain-containing protein [Gemmataceae bacterium]|nr:TIGR02996 domain-containing protein [Gemmataceae bacterium]